MKSSRRRSREFALQGLYQWQLAGTDPLTIVDQLSEAEGYDKIDADYFKALLTGAAAGAADMEQLIAPLLDRAYKSLSPVERGILLLAGHEFRHQPEVPYRVVINEAIELAKSFGGTDGHKYVNGVLDKMAAQLRAVEVNADR
jgi:N utilization substance protein B